MLFNKYIIDGANMNSENFFEERSILKKAITKSQHCQRNWDLTKQIPNEDLEVLEFAATQCPSKQNIAHYKVHMITNRQLIEQIHAETNGFVYRDTVDGPKPYTPTSPVDPEMKYTTNTQVLANLLIVLEDYTDLSLYENKIRNSESNFVSSEYNVDNKYSKVMHFDRNVAVGIAAGYLNLTATLLGYSTGCCTCMNHENIKNILGMKTHPLLLMGIGFKNVEKNRRIHQLMDNFIFPAKPKQEIPIIRHS
jgi:nitroreductase